MKRKRIQIIIITLVLILFFSWMSFLFKTNKPKVKITFLEEIVINKYKVIKPYSNVVATVYYAVPEQTNADYLHTATMFKLDATNQYKHRIVALSRDLLKLYPYGSKVTISGTNKYDGIWVVEDTMNKRYTKRIDFLVNQDMGLGKWNKVKIQLL